MQISAKKGDGVDDLLETVLLMAEVEELLANPDRPARGTIVESHLDKKTGAVATMLVAAGTLRQGDVVQAGAAFGKVRPLFSSPASPRLALSYPAPWRSTLRQATGVQRRASVCKPHVSPALGVMCCMAS